MRELFFFLLGKPDPSEQPFSIYDTSAFSVEPGSDTIHHSPISGSLDFISWTSIRPSKAIPIDCHCLVLAKPQVDLIIILFFYFFPAASISGSPPEIPLHWKVRWMFGNVTWCYIHLLVNTVRWLLILFPQLHSGCPTVFFISAHSPSRTLGLLRGTLGHMSGPDWPTFIQSEAAVSCSPPHLPHAAQSHWISCAPE